MKCEKCDVEMKLVRHKTEDVGAMGKPLYASHYRCLNCGRAIPTVEYGASDLAQDIDKKILNKLIKI